MGKRGPRPAPTALKVLRGAKATRINTAEPVPATDEVVRPDWLPADAVEVWERLAPDLIDKGVITPWDVDLFANLCVTMILYRQAARECFDPKTGAPIPTVAGDRGGTVKNPAMQLVRDLNAQLVTLAGRFGLTPSDRSQLRMGGGDGKGATGERFLT